MKSPIRAATRAWAASHESCHTDIRRAPERGSRSLLRTRSASTRLAPAILGWVILLVGSCSNEGDKPNAPQKPKSGSSDRLHLTAETIANLGITWQQTAESQLELRLDLPGELVASQDRTWHVRAPIAGTLISVRQRWERVKAKEIVAEIVSPELARVQSELFTARDRAHESRLDLERAQAEVNPKAALASALESSAKEARAAVSQAEAVLKQARKVAAAAASRVSELEHLQSEKAIARPTLIAARRESLEMQRAALDAERALRRARVEAHEQALKATTARVEADQSKERIQDLTVHVTAAEAAYSQTLAALATQCGMPLENLMAVKDGAPKWAQLDRLPMRAPSDGIVVNLDAPRRSWVERDAHLLEIQDPRVLLFRARLPEADLKHVRPGAEIVIEVAGAASPLSVKTLGARPVADPKTRTILIEAEVPNPDGSLRPGLSALGRLHIGENPVSRVIVPEACVVRSGLESVVFVRDPSHEDDVIRTPVTLGRRSGGRVEILSGLDAKATIVRDGARQLAETPRADGSSKGGHFHADGTFHEDH